MKRIIYYSIAITICVFVSLGSFNIYAYKQADLDRLLSTNSCPNGNLTDAPLQDANLKDANLQGAKLQGANLNNAHFANANLDHANLFGASLRGTNFTSAILVTANISNTTIGVNVSSVCHPTTKTNFTKANLRLADFRGSHNPGSTISFPSITKADINLYESAWGGTWWINGQCLSCQPDIPSTAKNL